MVKKYKIILLSGRELGPLTEEEIKKFIEKNVINGSERARIYPDGEWNIINKIPELAQLFMSVLEKELGIQTEQKNIKPIHTPQEPVFGTTVVIENQKVQSQEIQNNENKVPIKKEKNKKKKTLTKTDIDKKKDKEERFAEIKKEIKKVNFNEEDKTEIFNDDFSKKNLPVKNNSYFLSENTEPEKTVLYTPDEIKVNAPILNKDFNKPTSQGVSSWLRLTFIGILFYLVFDSVFEDEGNNKSKNFQPSIMATMPRILDTPPQPDASEKLYLSALEDYSKDNVKHYVNAVKKLHLAIVYDKNNVRALSMLASAYLNLIDAAHKKENYFTVVRELIEMARAKNLDLLETVIADIEFYITVDQLLAAESRIVDFTKGKDNYPIELFYYLSYVYYLSENYEEAKKFISRFDESTDFILGPRVLYLKGLISEKLGSIQESENFYKKNLKKFPEHTKSILSLVDVLRRQGKEKEGQTIIEVLILNKEYLTLKELAKALYLSGIISKNIGDIKKAYTRVQMSVKLNPENSEFILEYFNLRALLGAHDPQLKSKAKVYFFLSEAEKLYQNGNYDEALQSFIKASFEDNKSPLPHAKLGDIFFRKRQLRNAKESYRKAVFLDPRNINYWSKYIQILLESYEWSEIEKTIKRLSLVPSQKSASLVRRIRGEISARQGNHREAIENYKRAMSYDDIDTEVYIAYAQSLLALKEYEQARFFFSLGRRFDPFNMNAILGISHALSLEKSLDESIRFLENELKKQGGKNADILSRIAELKIQKGDIYGARNTIDKAKALDPESASPYKIEGEIELSQKNDKKAIERALNAFKFYSDRNSSDPIGYIKRFEIYMQSGNYNNAKTELERVYKDYPRYPGLHFLYGELFSALGNREEAISEYKQEISNHPGAFEAMLKLGILLIESGEPREALNLFIQADKLRGSQWAEAKSWAGYANFIMKNYEGAVALYLSAIQIDGGNPIHYKRIGFAQLAQGDQVNARQSFSKYLQLAPDAPDRDEIAKQIQ